MTKHHANALRCRIHPLGSLKQYTFVVVCARYGEQWLLSRHKCRATWETQGGHIEPGEIPMDAARRELYEESGVTEADIYPVCDYVGYTDSASAGGMVFLAVVRELGTLPDSEMAETKLFDVLPEKLTYPQVSPQLYEACRGYLSALNKKV